MCVKIRALISDKQQTVSRRVARIEMGETYSSNAAPVNSSNTAPVNGSNTAPVNGSNTASANRYYRSQHYGSKMATTAV